MDPSAPSDQIKARPVQAAELRVVPTIEDIHVLAQWTLTTKPWQRSARILTLKSMILLCLICDVATYWDWGLGIAVFVLFAIMIMVRGKGSPKAMMSGVMSERLSKQIIQDGGMSAARIIADKDGLRKIQDTGVSEYFPWTIIGEIDSGSQGLFFVSNDHNKLIAYIPFNTFANSASLDEFRARCKQFKQSMSK